MTFYHSNAVLYNLAQESKHSIMATADLHEIRLFR